MRRKEETDEMEEHLKHTPPPKGGRRRRERGKERESRRCAAGREGSASMGFTLTDGAAVFPRAKGERGRVKRRRRWKTRQKSNAQRCVYPQR